jgi:hypothetical protein
MISWSKWYGYVYCTIGYCTVSNNCTVFILNYNRNIINRITILISNINFNSSVYWVGFCYISIYINVKFINCEVFRFTCWVVLVTTWIVYIYCMFTSMCCGVYSVFTIIISCDRSNYFIINSYFYCCFRYWVSCFIC